MSQLDINTLTAQSGSVIHLSSHVSGSATSTGSFGRVEATRLSGDGTDITGLSSFAGAAGTEALISGSSTSTGSFGHGYYAGNVGIGTTSPGYNLEVAGTFYSAGSSIDYKKHVTDLDVDSSLIHSLRPVSYNYKKEYKDFGYNVKEGKQIGLVSEEVAETIPELAIMKDGRPKNVDYQKLAVVLLAEVQSLKKDIEELKKDN